LVAEHPPRERFAGQLIVALYRADRQADARWVYHATRAVLVEQLGIEPGPPLRESRVSRIVCARSGSRSRRWGSTRGGRRPLEDVGRDRDAVDDAVGLLGERRLASHPRGQRLLGLTQWWQRSWGSAIARRACQLCECPVELTGDRARPGWRGRPVLLEVRLERKSAVCKAAQACQDPGCVSGTEANWVPRRLKQRTLDRCLGVCPRDPRPPRVERTASPSWAPASNQDSNTLCKYARSLSISAAIVSGSVERSQFGHSA
jgi:transcriptional activator